MIQTLLLITFYVGHLCPGDNLSQFSHKDTFDIESYHWLVGSWKGNGFGGISEEMWASPVDGKMMGMYRHFKDGKIVFYEFMLLDKDGLHLKHFHPDLTGWEEKDDYLTFKTEAYKEGQILLKGLQFEKKSATQVEIRLRMKQGDEVHTEVFTMEKQ